MKQLQRIRESTGERKQHKPNGKDEGGIVGNAYEIIQGNALDVLRGMESESVQMCCTSPPYYGLRDYGSDGQIGLESSPLDYIAKIVKVFQEIRRVLKQDGIAWLNLGDSYNSIGHEKSNSGYGTTGLAGGKAQEHTPLRRENTFPGLKRKDLMMMPHRTAIALQDDGWWVRQDIVWSKPNPMPESVTDRCTKSHEYIFLLTKSAKYYFDQDAIREPLKDASIARLGQDVESQEGSDRVPGKTNGKMKAVLFGGNNRCPDTRLQSGKEWEPKGRDRSNGNRNGLGASTLDHKNLDMPGRQVHTLHANRADGDDWQSEVMTANKKSVWTVTTQPFKDAHFATFPEKLIEPCILAGSREGDLVLDPFCGSGTTGLVSLKHRRRFVGIELNPDYIKIAEKRLKEIQVRLF